MGDLSGIQYITCVVGDLGGLENIHTCVLQTRLDCSILHTCVVGDLGGLALAY